MSPFEPITPASAELVGRSIPATQSLLARGPTIGTMSIGAGFRGVPLASRVAKTVAREQATGSSATWEPSHRNVCAPDSGIGWAGIELMAARTLVG